MVAGKRAHPVLKQSIHAQQNKAGDWNWMVPDGLGSVRGVADDAVTTLESQSYMPYGEPFGVTGTNQTPYGFTGEHTDPTTDLLYLRARYYAPGLGVFTALDPFEGMAGRPMSLNGYSWVEGNVPNMVDPVGQCPENPWWNDIPGQRCTYLVNRFCDIHGCSETGRQALMSLEWWELEELTLAETVDYWGGFGRWVGDRAVIIPNLFLQNPLVARQALQSYFSCGGGLTLGSVMAPKLRGGAGLGIPGLIALTGLLIWLATQEYSEPRVRPRNRIDTLINFYRGNTYYDLLRTRDAPIEDVIEILSARQQGREIEQNVFYTSVNRDVALYFAFLETGNRPGQGGAGMMSITLSISNFRKLIAKYGVIHNQPTEGLPPAISQPHVETLFPFASLPDLFTVSQISVELIPT